MCGQGPMVGPDLSWCPVAMTGDQPASEVTPPTMRCLQVFRSLLCMRTTAAYRSPIGTNRPVYVLRRGVVGARRRHDDLADVAAHKSSFP